MSQLGSRLNYPLKGKHMESLVQSLISCSAFSLTCAAICLGVSDWPGSKPANKTPKFRLPQTTGKSEEEKLEFYEPYEFIGGPLCGLEAVLGRVPDGSNLFIEVSCGYYPNQIVTQAQYCLKLSELKLFFVSEICISKPPRKQ